ncbi:hypothetical protein B7P43_G06030 [Cryptotermes secundus]|uniref:Uncharacterized protein n=1 Tax=Cryptotermes secundus TaxID=105785 RepID=A0A2J7PDB7_9NEOP|nr:hypothetical protein B7P43_G06030 [Cryptotermes secundus]
MTEKIKTNDLKYDQKCNMHGPDFDDLKILKMTEKIKKNYLKYDQKCNMQGLDFDDLKIFKK